MTKALPGWQEVLLADAALVNWGDTSTTKASYVASGFLAYSATGPDGYLDHFDHEGPGIVLSAIGAQCGKTWYAQGKWSCIKNTIVLKARQDFADPRYLYFATSDPEFWPKRGAAQPFISQGDARRIPMLLPPLETQQRIAAILGAYDDLIEVNRRRVAVLEEMARGLFEEWFVRFRFPGHETVPLVDTPDGPLPERWEWINLYDAADVAFGFAFKSKAFTTVPLGARVVRIRDVLEGRTSTWTQEEFDDRYQVRNGDLLVGMDGIFHTNVWVGGDAALNQRVTRLRPKRCLSVGWLFRGVLPKIKFFEATISGTTVAHLGAKHLKTIALPLADDQTQRRADAFFAPIDDELVNLKVANEKLGASRDLLLPRLISGQLSVEAAERELENAA